MTFLKAEKTRDVAGGTLLALLAGIVVALLWWAVQHWRAELSTAELKPAELTSADLSQADLSSTELTGGEFTGERARLNGIECPVYVRANGTYFAVAGAERIDVERVTGYVRRNGNVVRPHYRTVADNSAGNNLSADLHRGDE